MRLCQSWIFPGLCLCWTVLLWGCGDQTATNSEAAGRGGELGQFTPKNRPEEGLESELKNTILEKRQKNNGSADGGHHGEGESNIGNVAGGGIEKEELTTKGRPPVSGQVSSVVSSPLEDGATNTAEHVLLNGGIERLQAAQAQEIQAADTGLEAAGVLGQEAVRLQGVVAQMGNIFNTIVEATRRELRPDQMARVVNSLQVLMGHVVRHRAAAEEHRVSASDFGLEVERGLFVNLIVDFDQLQADAETLRQEYSERLRAVEAEINALREQAREEIHEEAARLQGVLTGIQRITDIIGVDARREQLNPEDVASFSETVDELLATVEQLNGRAERFRLMAEDLEMETERQQFAAVFVATAQIRADAQELRQELANRLHPQEAPVLAH